MYIVYFSYSSRGVECFYAMNAHEINNMLRNRGFQEITEWRLNEIGIGTNERYEDAIIDLVKDTTVTVTVHKLYTRGVFMAIFRAEPDQQGLSNDDRAEVFGGIMLGASDFTADGIQSILNDYDVRHIDVIDYNLEPDDFQVQMDVVAQNYVQMYDHLKSERAQQ